MHATVQNLYVTSDLLSQVPTADMAGPPGNVVVMLLGFILQRPHQTQHTNPLVDTFKSTQNQTLLNINDCERARFDGD